MTATIIAEAADRPNKAYIESTGEYLPDSLVTSVGYEKKFVYKYDSEGRKIREEEYDRKKDNGWYLRESTNRRFDDKGRELLHEYYVFHTYRGHSSMTAKKFVTEYIDEENRALTSDYKFSIEDSDKPLTEDDADLILIETGEKQYNSDNQLITATYWTPDRNKCRIYSYAYTEAGDPLCVDANIKVGDSPVLNPYEKVEWTYGNNSGTKIHKLWNDEDRDLRNYSKCDFKLNENGDTIAWSIYFWDNESGKWDGEWKWEYKYDEQYRLVEMQGYAAGPFFWYLKEREEYQYGKHGIERVISYNNYSSEEMTATDVDLYLFNESGRLEMHEWYTWKEDLGDFELYAQTRYYYGQDGIAESAVATMPAVRLSGLTLCLDEPQVVSVYTTSGHVVYSGHASSVALPSAGLYLVRTAKGCTKVMAR